MTAYVPLMFLIVTVVGGLMALAEITPVQQPPRLVMIGRTSGNDGLAFGYLPPVTTPVGPLLTRTMPSDFTPPVGAGQRGRLYVATRFTVPDHPTFRRQHPTRRTGELEIVRG